MTIQSARIKALNRAEERGGDYVLYWMQQSQRAEDNHALEYAVRESNRRHLTVVVAFCLTDNYPEANLRHYTFMLEGLRETRHTLHKRGIRMLLRIGNPVGELLDLCRKAALIVCDRGYLRHQRLWRRELAENAECPVVQVETDVVVPVETVSEKSEYAAYTIRPKINRQLARFLVPMTEAPVLHPSLDRFPAGRDLDDIQSILGDLKIDKSTGPVTGFFKGGTARAKSRFDNFTAQRFSNYADLRNEPKAMAVSGMSPYLHFGQISPLYLALKAKALEPQFPESAAAFLEELIVRRELAMNFTYYDSAYDSLACLPQWAGKTLADHSRDPRERVYSRQQLIECRTHDKYWNAAMGEMLASGFMHNYMRMYWGKKILEWRPTPEDAHETLIFLNNTYFLDGRDPSSYAGAAWIFGRHDRAWFERPIFGKVRYMAASGLERKCDIKGYVDWVDQISGRCLI